MATVQCPSRLVCLIFKVTVYLCFDKKLLRCFMDTAAQSGGHACLTVINPNHIVLFFQIAAS